MPEQLVNQILAVNVAGWRFRLGLLQVSVVELTDSLPSSWVDEIHEKVLWALLSLIVIYIGNQLRYRYHYTQETRKAAEKLNPRSDRVVNGKTNSATLLNYVIDDVRELRATQSEIVQRLDEAAHKNDIQRLDTEVRDIRKRLDRAPG